jgi:hypothetical protein
LQQALDELLKNPVVHLLSDPEIQQDSFRLFKRLIDFGRIRMVLRSLHGNFKRTAVRVGDAEDRNHACGPGFSLPTLISVVH